MAVYGCSPLRTKGIPDLEMLQIFHNPINNQINSQNSYTVEAIIDDLSQTGLVEQELKVFWWTNDIDELEEVVMSVCSQDIPDCYTASIPSQVVDSNIKYYIQALDNSGRLETLPIAGYFDFDSTGIPSLPGDINGDNAINVLDVVLLVNIILNSDLGDTSNADLNGDNTINILDVVSLINLILEV